MTIKSENNIFKNTVHLLTILMVVWLITPYFYRNVPLIVGLILIVIWIFIAGLSTMNKEIRIPKYFMYSFIYLGIILSYRILGLSSAAWGNYVKLIIFFFFSWVYFYYKKNMDTRKQTQLINIGIFISIINVWSNIYLLYLYPNASVELNFSRMFYNTNVGGTMFSFYSVLLVVLFLVTNSDLKNKKIKLLYILSMISLFIYILQAARSISIFVLLVAISLYFYNKLSVIKNRVERVLYKVFIIMLSFIFLINLVNILIILNNYIGIDRITVRINAIIATLSGGGSEQAVSLLSRLQLYELSITTFFSSIENFIFGVGYHTTEQLSTGWLFNIGVGNHSEVLDIAARYGLIGLLPIFMFLHRFFRYVQYDIQIKDIYNFKLIGIIFLIYSILNNSFDPSLGVLVFLIIPLYFTRMENIKEKKMGETDAV